MVKCIVWYTVWDCSSTVVDVVVVVLDVHSSDGVSMFWLQKVWAFVRVCMLCALCCVYDVCTYIFYMYADLSYSSRCVQRYTYHYTFQKDCIIKFFAVHIFSVPLPFILKVCSSPYEAASNRVYIINVSAAFVRITPHVSDVCSHVSCMCARG